MDEVKLDIKEAYKAMYEFLNIQYNLTNTIEVRDLLSYMSLLDDGTPADAAMWEDWIKAIENSKENPDGAKLNLND